MNTFTLIVHALAALALCEGLAVPPRPLNPSVPAGSAAARLRALLAKDGILTMPCCFDALSARLIERAGFDITFMSGFSTSAAKLGLPDTGYIR